jgi:hypothetical protein
MATKKKRLGGRAVKKAVWAETRRCETGGAKKAIFSHAAARNTAPKHS